MNLVDTGVRLPSRCIQDARLLQVMDSSWRRMLYGSALKPVCLPVLRLRHPRTMPIDILSEDFCVILARCRDLYCRLYPTYWVVRWSRLHERRADIRVDQSGERLQPYVQGDVCVLKGKWDLSLTVKAKSPKVQGPQRYCWLLGKSAI